MSYILFALGIYLTIKAGWEIYLYFNDRSMFERMRAEVEDGEYGDGEDIENPSYLFFAYPFLIGICFFIGYLFYIS